MKLVGTIYAPSIYIEDSKKHKRPTVIVEGPSGSVVLDQTLACELIPKLEHFIEHGELPE